MIAPHLYDYHYWFSSRPGPLSLRGVSILLFILGVMVVGDIVLRIVAKKKRKVWDALSKKLVNRIHNCLSTMTVFGLIITFFDYQGIPVLGARYLLLLWGLVFLVWALSITHEGYVKNRANRQESIKKGEFTKYFRKK